MAMRFWHGSRIKRHFSSRGMMGTSRRLEPAVVREARHSDFPNVSTYDRPATTRMTMPNLTLSIIVLVSTLIIFGVVLWTVFR